jgi:flavin reductase (DIM6/NTAB) family NADH-FMN oxidoreductase RutF
VETKRSYDGNVLGPLPLALVGANVDGRPNYLVIGYCAPFDFGKQVFFSLYKKRHTAAGILEDRTFSVNIPSVDLMDRVKICGSTSGRDLDKSTLFETFYGELETAPMIRECPLNMECKVTEIVDTELNHGVIGRIAKSYVNEELLKDEKAVDMARVNLFSWMIGGDFGYYRLGERIDSHGA